MPTGVLIAALALHISTVSTIGLGIAGSIVGICVGVLVNKTVSSIFLFLQKTLFYVKYPKLTGIVLYSLGLLLIIWMYITLSLAFIATIFIVEEGILG